MLSDTNSLHHACVTELCVGCGVVCGIENKIGRDRIEDIENNTERETEREDRTVLYISFV